MYRTYDGHYIDYGDEDEKEDYDVFRMEYEAPVRHCLLCGAAFEADDDHDEDCSLYRERELPF